MKNCRLLLFIVICLGSVFYAGAYKRAPMTEKVAPKMRYCVIANNVKYEQTDGYSQERDATYRYTGFIDLHGSKWNPKYPYDHLELGLPDLNNNMREYIIPVKGTTYSHEGLALYIRPDSDREYSLTISYVDGRVVLYINNNSGVVTTFPVELIRHISDGVLYYISRRRNLSLII